MDLFVEPDVTDGTIAGEIKLHSVGQARNWLENRGWQIRYDGGYWKGSNGTATIFTDRDRVTGSIRTVVKVHTV